MVSVLNFQLDPFQNVNWVCGAKLKLTMCSFMFHSLLHIIERDDQLLFYPRCLNGNLTMASTLHIVTHNQQSHWSIISKTLYFSGELSSKRMHLKGSEPE